MPRKAAKRNNSNRNIKNPCGICSNPVAVTHKDIWRDSCNFWIHAIIIIIYSYLTRLSTSVKYIKYIQDIQYIQ